MLVCINEGQRDQMSEEYQHVHMTENVCMYSVCACVTGMCVCCVHVYTGTVYVCMCVGEYVCMCNLCV